MFPGSHDSEEGYIGAQMTSYIEKCWSMSDRLEPLRIEGIIDRDDFYIFLGEVFLYFLFIDFAHLLPDTSDAII
jgi:hypothetical protein